MANWNLLSPLKAEPVPSNGAALEADFVMPADTSRTSRFGLGVLGIGFGGFLLWAALAPLDEGVPTQGMVSLDTKRKDVQHMSGGLVREVYVREGQFVAKDQPLIRLDDASVAASLEAVRQHYYTLRAMEGRLEAEQMGHNGIIFHPDLLRQDDPRLNEIRINQQQLFQSRRMALHADLQAIEESIQGQQAAIQGLQGMLEARSSQQEFVQEELRGVRDLVREGYAPRNKQLELERMAAETMGSISDVQANILRARRAIAEMRMRAVQRAQEYRKEVEGMLSDVRREVQADAEKFKAAKEEMDRTFIRAPAAGQVLGLTVQTVGAVIGPGQRLMEIVPQNERLLMEARVPPHLIDRIHPGLATDVRFSAFAHSPSLVVQGSVDSISSDLITDPKSNVAYYLARISLTTAGLKELGQRQMQAGMPAEVVIKTGARTVMAYLLHPFLKRMATSMKEE